MKSHCSLDYRFFFLMKLKIIIQPTHLPQCVVLYDKTQYRLHCFTASESLFWTCRRITPLPTCTRVEVHGQCQPVGYDGSDICNFQVGEFKIEKETLKLSSCPKIRWVEPHGRNFCQTSVSLHPQAYMLQRLPPLPYLGSTNSKLWVFRMRLMK